MSDAGGHSRCVMEMQGLYGPFAFPERLLQKIWLLGLFDPKALRLADGAAVEVLSPGQWNLLGGPDFRGARLRLGDRVVQGDVEVHFRAEDWWHHGHDRDPAYDNVVLHVLLFEPRAGVAAARTSTGREVPQLVLLPILHCNLEEFAADDAIETAAQRSGSALAAELLQVPATLRLERLWGAAEMRWRQKVHFAEVRIARLGWREACHHTALEILGYQFNRAPMLGLAARFPLAEMAGGGRAAEELWAAERLRWRQQGVRPANLPARRIAQYLAWVQRVPDWPERWEGWADSASAVAAVELKRGVARVRREHRFAAWREQLAARIAGGAVTGPRWDSLVVNGLLPLLAARTGAAAFGRWAAWFPSEVPRQMTQALRLAGVTGRGGQPAHEAAVQGVLHLHLEGGGGRLAR